MDEFPVDLDLELAHNPMMQNKGNIKAQKEAEEKARVLGMQLQEQSENNAKMVEMMRKSKSKSNTNNPAKKRKKKKGRTKKETQQIRVDTGSAVKESELEMSVFASKPETLADNAVAIVVDAEVVSPPNRVPTNPQIRGGYRKSLDQASGKHYYFNAETRKTQWETPDEWK